MRTRVLRMLPTFCSVGRHLTHSFASVRSRKIGLAVLVVRALIVAPTPIAAEQSAVAPPAPRVPVGQTQELSVHEVLIEGKLYSPQALFIVSRPHEQFERACVFPHYLRLDPSTRPLPYRLRRDVFDAQRPTQIREEQTELPEDSGSRRSP